MARLMCVFVVVAASVVAADPAPPNADLLAAESAAYEKARPAFERWCAGCHTRGAKSATAKKLDHFEMTGYPFGGHHAATIGTTIRTVLGLGGKKATMPANKPGSVTRDDLATIEAWIAAWDAAETAGAHPKAPSHHHD